MTAELGSAARPRRRKHLGDTCPRCKGTSLWGNFYSPDGDGSDGSSAGDRWLTLCADCGTFWA